MPYLARCVHRSPQDQQQSRVARPSLPSAYNPTRGSLTASLDCCRVIYLGRSAIAALRRRRIDSRPSIVTAMIACRFPRRVAQCSGRQLGVIPVILSSASAIARAAARGAPTAHSAHAPLSTSANAARSAAAARVSIARVCAAASIDRSPTLGAMTSLLVLRRPRSCSPPRRCARNTMRRTAAAPDGMGPRPDLDAEHARVDRGRGRGPQAADDRAAGRPRRTTSRSAASTCRSASRAPRRPASSRSRRRRAKRARSSSSSRSSRRRTGRRARAG